jgi:nitrate/nitrite transporter NarK
VAAGVINGIGSIGPIFQEQVIGWMLLRYSNSLAPMLLMLVGVAVVGTLLMGVLHLRARKAGF